LESKQISIKLFLNLLLTTTINKNIAKGYMMEARERRDGKKAWMIT